MSQLSKYKTSVVITPKQVALEIADYIYYKLNDKAASSARFLNQLEQMLATMRRTVFDYKLSNHDIYELIKYPTSMSTLIIRNTINKYLRKFKKTTRDNCELAFYTIMKSYKPDEELIFALSCQN